MFNIIHNNDTDDIDDRKIASHSEITWHPQPTTQPGYMKKGKWGGIVLSPLLTLSSYIDFTFFHCFLYVDYIHIYVVMFFSCQTLMVCFFFAMVAVKFYQYVLQIKHIFINFVYISYETNAYCADIAQPKINI